MEKQRGFTLVELLLACSAGLLVLGIAVPAASGTLEAARAADARGALLSSLVATAGKAAASGAHGVLCPSVDGHRCRMEPDWSRGWLAFLDRNGNREPDAGELVLHHRGALAGKVRLSSTAGRTRIVFQGNGGNAGSNVTFTLCDGRGASRARSLVMSNVGRLRDAPASPERAAATCAD